MLEDVKKACLKTKQTSTLDILYQAHVSAGPGTRTDRHTTLEAVAKGKSVPTSKCYNELQDWKFASTRLVTMGVCHPDPSQQLEAIEKIAAKMVEENKKVEFRYHAFCVKNGLSGGIPTQAQVDELWRYLSSEAREFAASPDKPEDPDLANAKEAKIVQAALAAAAKASANGDPKGGKDPKGKGDPKGGGTGGRRNERQA